MKKLAKPVDVQPIRIGGFELTATGLTVHGRPSYAEYLGAGDFIQRAHKAAGFWLADWLRYGESRDDWKAKLSQAIDDTGLTEQTLKNIRSVASIDASVRRADVGFSMHAEVVSLPPQEQERWLERAAVERLSVRDLRAEIRAEKRTKVIEGQAHLDGQYRIWMSDPPWPYDDSSPTEDGSLGKAERHYPAMSMEDMAKIPVREHTTHHATHFMWCTAPFLKEGIWLLEQWGFTYKTSRVWDKVRGNPSSYATHIVHEHLLIGVKNMGTPDVTTPQEKSIFTERRSDVHSEKPESVRQWIMKHWTVGPYVELFARQKVDGWASFGNDPKLWTP